MSLKLYYNLMSQPSRSLYILLKFSGTQFEKMPVDLRSGAHITEEYTKNINRFQRVPVINYNGFILTESIAIIRYLSNQKLIDKIYPNNSEIQARVDEFLEWHHINLRFPCSMFFRVKVLEPRISGVPTAPEKLENFKERMIESVNNIERKWLGRYNYLVSDQLTVADLWAACELEQTRMAGFDPCEGRPNMSVWMNKVRSELSPHYEEAHIILNKMVNKAIHKEKESKL